MARRRKRKEYRQWSDDLIPVVKELLVELADPSVTNVCRILNIERCGFYLRYADNPELKEAVENSRKLYHEKMRETAKLGLYKLAKGGRTREITEEPLIVKTQDGQLELVDQKMSVTKRVRKSVLPDLGACKKILESVEPETWTPREKKEVSGSISMKHELSPDLEAKLDEVLGDG